MNTQNKIDMVVPLYVNHPSLYSIIEKFFTSMKENYPEINLIVIDDCSPLPHDFPVTERNETNLGYVKTINKGMELSTAPIILVFNDDLVIKKGDLDHYKFMSEIMIASCQDTAGTTDDMFGSNFGMTRETYELLGGFDERYKNYFADREYYNRAKENNVRVIKWMDKCLEHHESATFKHENKEKIILEDQTTFLS